MAFGLPPGPPNLGLDSLPNPIGGLTGLLGVPNEKPAPGSGTVPAIPRKTQQIDPTRWNQLHTYSFSVRLSAKDGSTLRTGPDQSLLDQLKIGESAVPLAIPPSAVNVTTQFASSTTATNKGVLEENNGVVFRQITISGTTGVFSARQNNQEPAPSGLAAVASAIFPSAFGAVQNLVQSAQRVVASGSQQPNQLSEKQLQQTGYFQFWKLHNFFVAYAEAKKKKKGQGLRLVFSSPKDNIAYTVTPVSFELKRDSGSPLLYKYAITLKAWDIVESQAALDSQFQAEVPTRNDTLSVAKIAERVRRARKAIQAASGVIQGVQSDIFDILNTVNQATLALKDIAGIGNQVIDFLPTIKANADLLITTNKNQWAQIVADRQDALTQAGGASAVGATGTFLAAGTLAASGTLSKDQITGNAPVAGQARPSVTGETASKEASDPSALQVINTILNTPDLAESIPLEELAPLPSSVQSQVDQKLLEAQATTSGQVSSLTDKLQEVSDNLAYAAGMMDPVYALTYGLPAPGAPPRPTTEDDILLAAQIEDARDALISTLATGTIYSEKPGNPFDTANSVVDPEHQIPTPTSAFAIAVPRGFTLERIAAEALGDASRAREIAILNDLRAPYIDEDGFIRSILLAAGRTFVIQDRTNLVLDQIIRIAGSGLPTLRRKVLAIDDIGGGSFRVTVDGSPNLDVYTPGSAPFIATRLPGTVGSGDTLLIPSVDGPDQDGNDRPTPLSDRLTFAERIFKVDLALGETGDLSVGASGDISRSYGYSNAVQALRLLIEVERGELELHPDYGLLTAVGQRNSLGIFNEVSSRIRSAVLADPRFTDADVNVIPEGNAIRIRIVAQGREGTGRVPVEFKISA